MRVLDFFKVPKLEDGERFHQAWSLHIILWTVIVFVTAMMTVDLLTLPQNTVRWLVVIVFINSVCLFLLYLNHRGHTRGASIGAVVSYWLLVTVLIATENTLRAPGAPAYLLIIFASGLLLGTKAGVVTGIVCGLTATFFMVLESYGYFQKSAVQHTTLIYWFTQVIFMFMILSLQWLANRSVKLALKRAQHELQERKRTEDILRESEQRYREVFENTSDLMFLSRVEPDGTVYFDRFNGAYERLLNISSEEFRGKQLDTLFPREDLEEVKRRFHECLTTKEPVSYEAVRTIRGVQFCLWATLIPLKNAQGRIDRVIGVGHNITERKKQEEQLRALSERLRLATETAGIGIWDLDIPKGELLWDKRVFEIYGLQPTRTMSEAKWASFVHPEDLPKQVATLQRVIAEKGRSNRELRIIRPDGALRYLQTSEAVIVDHAGKASHLVGTCMDVTDLKSAEATLRESEELYRIVVEQTGQMVYDYDIPRGKIKWQGAITQLTGFPAREFESVGIQQWEDRIHPDDRLNTLKAREHAMNTVGFFRAEYRFRCRNNSYIVVDDHGVFLPSPSGKAVRMLGTMSDITARKQAEERNAELTRSLEERVRQRTAELESANRELESFSYSVSHDLRGPLRVIDGFSELLLRQAAKLPPGSAKLLGEIQGNTKRMNELINDLLQLSRVGRQPLKTAEIDIQDLVARLISEMRQAEKEREIKVTVGRLPPCRGDASLIEQIFINLLSNAFKFTSRRPAAAIEVNGEKRGAEVQYSVRDNGAGFSMEDETKLFAPFERLHTTTEFEGTGIGLSIVKRIIERHGGRIWAESAVDQGTTFTFTLPAVG